MIGKNKVSSLQFFICMFLCNMFLTLGFMSTGAEKNSILVNVIFTVVGIAFMIISFVPSYMVFNKTGKTSIELLSENFKGFSVIVKLFYLICFSVFISVILNKYTKFLTEQINNEALPVVLFAVFLVIGAFGCFKGMQALFRTAIILFAFSMFALVFVLIGLVPQIDISNAQSFSPNINTQIKSGLETLFLSLIPITSYVVFSDSLKGNQKLGIFCSSFATFFLFLIIGVFVILVIGEYSIMLEYPVSVASKLSRISILKGGDGLLFSSITSAVFLLCYLFFISGSKTIGAYHSKTFSIAFAFITFILATVMNYVPILNDFLSNSLFLSLIAVVAAVVIPVVSYVLLRKRVSK